MEVPKAFIGTSDSPDGEMKDPLKDVCLNCGQTHEKKYGGANCSCDAPFVVHQYQCDNCLRVIGMLIDDDVCEPDTLYCPDCMELAKSA